MATVNTLAGDLYELAERGRVQGWLPSVWGVSAVLGPALGGSLAQYASWRWIFVINLPVGAVSLAMISRYLHEKVVRTPHRVDVTGGLLILLAAGSLVFGLLQGGTAWAWLSVPSVTVLAVSAGATALAVLVERRVPEPIMPPWVWNRRVLAGSACRRARPRRARDRPEYLPAYLRSGGTWPWRDRGRGCPRLHEHRLAARVVPVRADVPADRIPGHGGDRLGHLRRGRAVLGAGLRSRQACRSRSPARSCSASGWACCRCARWWARSPRSAWEQRGVVTGAVMFSRYLGQSLGAAIFGAVFNAAILHRLASAPPTLSRSAAAPGQRGRHSPGPVRATARRRRRLPPAGDLGRNARCLSRAGRGRGGDARRGARDRPAAVRDQRRSRGRSPRQLAHTRSGSSTWTSPVTGSRPVAIRAQVVSSHSPGSGAPARPSSTFRTSARAPGSAGGASSATVMSR